MALHQAREFQYRPPRRRKEQRDATERPRIEIPHASGGSRGGSLRLFILLAAILALAMILKVLV